MKSLFSAVDVLCAMRSELIRGFYELFGSDPYYSSFLFSCYLQYLVRGMETR